MESIPLGPLPVLSARLRANPFLRLNFIDPKMGGWAFLAGRTSFSARVRCSTSENGVQATLQTSSPRSVVIVENGVWSHLSGKLMGMEGFREQRGTGVLSFHSLVKYVFAQPRVLEYIQRTR